MDITEYIQPELYVIIPILYITGAIIKNSSIKDWKIPFILGAAGIILAAIWNLATRFPSDAQETLSVIFASITQGGLCAAASVYANNLYKQFSLRKNDNDNGDTTQNSTQNSDAV